MQGSTISSYLRPTRIFLLDFDIAAPTISRLLLLVVLHIIYGPPAMGICTSKGEDPGVRAHKDVEKQLKEVLIYALTTN